MEKKKKKIEEALTRLEIEREKAKVRYDTSIIILDGQREKVIELEKRHREHMDAYVDADNKIKDKISELKKINEDIAENYEINPEKSDVA